MPIFTSRLVWNNASPPYDTRLTSPPLALLMNPAPLGRVLVMDDDSDTAVSLGRLLLTNHYDARWCRDHTSCVDLVEKWNPDVALIEVGLRNSVGCELAKAIRAQPATCSIWLVAFVTDPSAKTQQKCEWAGFDWCMVKPVDWNELDKVLKAILTLKGNEKLNFRLFDEIHAGCRFSVSSVISERVWRVDWQCLEGGCSHRGQSVGANRQGAESAARQRMVEHAERDHRT